MLVLKWWSRLLAQVSICRPLALGAGRRALDWDRKRLLLWGWECDAPAAALAPSSNCDGPQQRDWVRCGSKKALRCSRRAACGKDVQMENPDPSRWD